MRRNAGSKIIILLLSFCLVFTMMPTAAFALPNTGTGTDAVNDTSEKTSEDMNSSDAQNSDPGNNDGSGNDSVSDQNTDNDQGSSTDNNSEPQSDQGTVRARMVLLMAMQTAKMSLILMR